MHESSKENRYPSIVVFSNVICTFFYFFTIIMLIKNRSHFIESELSFLYLLSYLLILYLIIYFFYCLNIQKKMKNGIK